MMNFKNGNNSNIFQKEIKSIVNVTTIVNYCLAVPNTNTCVKINLKSNVKCTTIVYYCLADTNYKNSKNVY